MTAGQNGHPGQAPYFMPSMQAAHQMRPQYYAQMQGPGAGPGARPRWPSNQSMPRMSGGQVGQYAPRVGGRPAGMPNAGPRPGIPGQPGGPRPLTGQQQAQQAAMQQVNRPPQGPGGPAGRPTAHQSAPRPAAQFVKGKQPNRGVGLLLHISFSHSLTPFGLTFQCQVRRHMSRDRSKSNSVSLTLRL